MQCTPWAIQHLNFCYKGCDISSLSFSDFEEREVASEQYRDDQACKELWLKTLQMVKLIWSIVLVSSKCYMWWMDVWDSEIL